MPKCARIDAPVHAQQWPTRHAGSFHISALSVTGLQVIKLNGKDISNLKDVVTIVDAYTGPCLHFDLEYDQKVIIPGPSASGREATEEILRTHCIPADRSADLLAP